MNKDLSDFLNYPNTKGKQVALNWFKWNSLTGYEEMAVAKDALRLAKLVDEALKKVCWVAYNKGKEDKDE